MGSADEQSGELGLAHVHEHMLFKGTATRDVGAIAAEVEAAGGDINAYTSYDETVYHLVMSSRFFDRGLDVLADAVQRSAFDPDELTRELEVVCEEIKQTTDSAPRLAAQLLFATAYPHHPYGRPVIGSEASVRSFTRDGILDFYGRWYSAANLTVSAVGDLDEAEASQAIASAFAGLEPGAKPPARPPQNRPPGLLFARVASRFAQTFVHIAFPCGGAGHPDSPVLDVLSLILGQGEASRLPGDLLRQRGLVNDVSAWVWSPRDAGLFVVSLVVAAGDARLAVRAALEHIATIRTTLVTQAELSRARTILESQQVYEFESVSSQARNLAWYETMCGGTEAQERHLDRIRALTPEALLEVAQRTLDPSAMSVACLVPTGGEDALSERFFAEALAEVLEATRPAAPAIPRRGPPELRSRQPELHIRRLDCGLRLAMIRDASAPLVALRTVMRGGMAAETPERAGIGRLLATTMNRGAGSRTAAEIAAEIEGMAAAIDVSSGRHSAGARLLAMSSRFDEAFPLYLDTVLRPRLEATEINRERELQTQQIRTQADRPATLCVRTMLSLLFGSHPYGGSVLGDEETIARVSRDDLVALHERLWRAPHMVMGCVGDIDPDTLAARIQAGFSAVARPADPVVTPPVIWPSARVERRIGGTGEQAHIAIGLPGMAWGDPARPILDVLISLLSGQGGRLFLELRDRRSLAYSVSASSFEGASTGYLLAYMGTSPDKLDEGLSGLTGVLNGLRQDTVGRRELDRARQYVAGSWDIGLQRRDARASTLAWNLLFETPEPGFAAYTDRVMAVTAAEVRSLAERLLVPDKAAVCILEPSKQDEG